MLFLFNATTHYYNLVLNRLDKDTDYEINIAVPKDRFRNVGPAVYQTEDNLKVPLYSLEEKTHRLWRCYFPELPALLWKLRPDVIVTLEPYQFGLFWHPLTRLLLWIFGTKVILKNIPFRMPNYRSPKEIYLSKYKGLRIGRTNLKKFWNEISEFEYTKHFYSRLYAAHVCYIEKAYEIYGTYSVDPKKIFITYNSPDTDYLLAMNEKAKSTTPILEENPFRLIHVGRLVEWKRVDLIIRAVQHLEKDFPKIELFVLGFGPMQEPWQNLAKELGVENRVKFVGGIYDGLELARYFRASQIYVLGGMGGLSINDAMTYELPILCSVCDGTEAHLVKDGYNGFYFNDGDYLDLAKKMSQILSQPELARQMGENSHYIIKNKINTQRVLEGYTKAFQFVKAKRKIFGFQLPGRKTLRAKNV